MNRFPKIQMMQHDRWVVCEGDLGADIYMEKYPGMGMRIVASGSLVACVAALNLLYGTKFSVVDEMAYMHGTG